MGHGELKNKNFHIGQIVYILSNKGQIILPAMIIEESIIQTLDGKKVSWKFALGQEGVDQKTYDSNEIDGDVYSSLDEIKEALTIKLSKFIEQLVDKANKYEKSWYGSQIKKAKEVGLYKQEKKSKIDPESLIEQFEDVNNEPAVEQNKVSYVDENGVKVNILGIENV